MQVIIHSRRHFYQRKNDIYWYEFRSGHSNIMTDTILKGRFLRIPETKYYEFGGIHADAIKALTDAGVNDIVEGQEI